MLSWLREPLLHFAVLGALIFAAYAWVGPKPSEATVVVVDEAVQQDLIGKFRSSTERDPTAQELDELIEGWVTKEVIYREGLAMGLDRSDGRTREIIISNMQALIRAQSVPDTPPDAELQRWFEARRAQYEQPQRFDFVQWLVDDTAPDGEARALLVSRSLANGGGGDDVRQQMRSYRQRTHEWIVRTFGEDFADQLERQPPGEWRAVQSSRGWHVLRLEGVHAPQTATFAELKEQVENDWRREREFQIAADTLRTVRASYTVQRSGQRSAQP